MDRKEAGGNGLTTSLHDAARTLVKRGLTVEELKLFFNTAER